MEKTEMMEKIELEAELTATIQTGTCGELPRWWYVRELERRIENLRDNASEVFIKDMQIHGGFLSLEAETSLGRVYSEYAAHMLEEYKAQNFVTCELKSGDSEQMYYLTVGRCNGKTVQEKYLEVCNEKSALEAKSTAYDRLIVVGRKHSRNGRISLVCRLQ